MNRWWSGTSRRSSWRRTAVAGVAVPAAATGLALVLHTEPALGSISVYLLGVVVATALGGALAGIVGSALCFLSLNFFFTEPTHTFRVANDEDVVALVVFLVVALIVGSLVSRVLLERARAVRNEREARLLGYIATQVMSGAALEELLRDVAGMFVETFSLARCEIAGRAGNRRVDVVRTSEGSGTGSVVTIPLRAASREVGTLTATRADGAGDLPAPEARLLGSAAGQLAIALERALLDSEIESARRQAETNEVRAALFSSVTHDLRTPLASIKAGVTSLLQDDVTLDEPRRRELLTTVLEETDRLNRLLGNLLELAKVRAGALVPAKEPTAIEDVVGSVLHRMERALAGVQVRTILRDAPDVPVDPVQIDQVLTNLLENAARHSPPGGEVVVSVAPWRDSVQVRVADHGPGIPEEERERVFDAFYRLDDEGSSGSGLGLAIARAIVLAHGGQIRIEGVPSGGAAVVFELPLSEGVQAPTEPVR
jgi:two-component system, OmpR family, sensor histidine kinase KdpD